MAENNRRGPDAWRPSPHANAAVHQQIIEDLKTMKVEDFMATLVRLGICTPDGELSPYYRGEPAREGDDEKLG